MNPTSLSHEAFLISLESVVRIAKECCLPTLSFEEFIQFAEIFWQNDEEKDEISPPFFCKAEIEEHLPAF